MRAASREALFYWNYTVGCQGFEEAEKWCFLAIEMKGKGLGVMKKLENNLYSCSARPPNFCHAHFFNPAVQFSTTVIDGGAVSAFWVFTRKRCPSRDGS